MSSADPASALAEARRRLLTWLETRTEPGRLPPLRKLAAELGVGLGSLNEAVGTLVGEGVLAARRGSGTYLLKPLRSSQSPMPAPAAPPFRGPRHVALLAAPSSDSMVTELRDCCAAALRAQGLTAEIRRLPRHDGRLPEDADALVLVNPLSHPPLVPNTGQPILLLSTAARVRIHATDQIDEVTIDSFAGAAMAGQHLRQLGCRSVCYVGVHREDDPQTYGVTSAIRLEGFESGWGQSVPPENLIRVVGYGELSGAGAAGDFADLPTQPDGIFAASDELAVGFIKGALAHRLHARRDYQIIGFDGQQIGQTLVSGPLTTVAAPISDMGRMGAQMLLERLSDATIAPRRVEMACRIVTGRTARAVVAKSLGINSTSGEKS